MTLTVYLAGQIHDDWRKTFLEEAVKMALPVNFVGPMEDHDRSDNIGEEIKGKQPNKIYKDATASEMNNLRTRLLMQKADLVVAWFGESFKQWNTSMDAGIAIGLGKPLILVRDENISHALKEISDHAQVTVETPQQALKAIQYILD